jgi:hypothetical protein
MVNPVNMMTPLFVGLAIASVIAVVGLYIALSRSPGDPPLSTRSKAIRSLIALGVASVAGLIIGSMTQTVLFDIANPEIAAVNFALGQTRGAIFGNR